MIIEDGHVVDGQVFESGTISLPLLPPDSASGSGPGRSVQVTEENRSSRLTPLVTPRGTVYDPLPSVVALASAQVLYRFRR